MLQQFWNRSVAQITPDAKKESWIPAPSVYGFETSCQCCSWLWVLLFPLGVLPLSLGVNLSTYSHRDICNMVILARSFDYELLCLSSVWRWPLSAARTAVRGLCIWKQWAVSIRSSRLSMLCKNAIWVCGRHGEHQGHIRIRFCAWCLCSQPFWAAGKVSLKLLALLGFMIMLFSSHIVQEKQVGIALAPGDDNIPRKNSASRLWRTLHWLDMGGYGQGCA